VLSVIDPGTRTEVAHHTGFGNLPGSLAVDANGTVYVGSFGAGVLVWDAASESFDRGLDNPVAPNGVASVSGLGLYDDATLFTLEPDCQNPARAFQLDDAYAVQDEVAAGVCPAGIGFGVVPDNDG
jgi:hypothetical protein